MEQAQSFAEPLLNHYPREIEDIILQHPAVSEVAVIGVPDELWGESVKAIVALRERVNRIANGLREISAAPEVRIASLAKNTDIFYEVLFGTAKASDVIVPVNWRLAPAEVVYIVNDAAAEVLFVGEES